MGFEIRKLVDYREEIWVEGGKALSTPIVMLGVAAIIKNPWHGRGFVEDLSPEIKSGASDLGELIVSRILQQMGGGEAIEAYGKAAVVGSEGEIEHASAVIHTLRFGNHFRDGVGATSYLSFTNKRGGPGTSIQIPMMNKHDEGARSHYITLEMNVSDAPAADEIVIVLGASSGGRAHPRIGNRYQDIEDLKAEAKG
ncbi:amino acid synthesis family protein [Dasania marina]|uniref:amino acid synthesis family protein n=1 Tax=Dasania marina TaxID=471499 RepID=UPI0030D6CF51|tara:strand:- start:37080 stop:37670 length:591 start_codon:yes stop_codon:yes gene_type:complete